MEKPDSNKVSSFVWVALAVTALVVVLFLNSWEEDAESSLERIESDKSRVAERPADPEPLFDDSDEEFEELFSNVLSVESRYLETDYEPLSKWLDERFEVKFRGLTPDLIFDQVPLNDILYEVADLSDRVETFDFSATNISRRELLQQISEHWDLDISYVYGADENQTPSALRVTGR